MKPVHLEQGQVWEAMSGTKVRQRKVISIEGGNIAVEENNTIKCFTITGFRSWISNFGARKV